MSKPSRNKSTTRRKLLIFSSIFLFVLLFVFYLSNRVVTQAAVGKIYSKTASIPKNKVGLVLGTSKYVARGKINLYYQFRIDATVALFKAGKIDFILVSGDNGSKSYNEPTTMQKDLIAAGIPAERIFLDYAGFRTLDSVIRSEAVFGQHSITIISQKFHVERAIYIAKKKGIKAIGFNAKDVSTRAGLKTTIRERFARIKVVLDIWFGKEPKFYGDKIEIN